MRVLHVITGLGLGGAEVMLHRLLGASDREALVQEVVSLTDLGVIGPRIQRLGIPVHALGMRRLPPDPAKLLRLRAQVAAFRPDVVQTWMYHADLLGGVAARLAGRARVVWGIHNSSLDPRRTRRTTHWTVALCARLSRRIPDAIVSVSRTARDLHVSLGYDARKFQVIPNGFDLEAFRPDPALRAEARAALGLAEGEVAVGLVARTEPQKDHANFIRAAALLAARRPEARFVLCGRGAEPGNAALAAAIAREGLAGRFLLLGPRDDTPRVLNALDVGTLSSAFGEAFPLAIGEAMACGVPCVVTDLGDCAHLVGETGWVVPPRDPAALAGAWEACLGLGAEGRRLRGSAARERIARHFALPRVAAAYADLYRQVLGTAATPPALSHAYR